MRFWERCDSVSCKEEPITYVSFHANSPFNKKLYRIWVRLCKTHYQKEKKGESFKLEKIRRGFKRLIHEGDC